MRADPISYPPALEADEARLVAARRLAAGRAPAPGDVEQPAPSTLPDDTIGLALSGGGVRSATFCLGVFQALAAARSVGAIDYLSTVSGGSYFAAFLGRLFTRGWIRNVDDVERVLQGEDPADTPPERKGWGPQVFRWLRDNGRYLAPRGSGDLLVLGAILLRNWVAVHIVLATTVLTVFVGLQIVRLGIDHAAAAVTSRSDLRSMLADALPFGNTLWWSPAAVVSLLLLALWAAPAGWAYWLIARQRSQTLTPMAGAALALLLALAGTLYYALVPHEGAILAVRLALCATVASVLIVTFVMRYRAARRAAAPGAGGTLSEGEADDWARMRLSRTLMHGLVVSGVIAAFAAVDTLGATLYAAAADGQLLRWGSAALGTFAGIGAFARPIWTLLAPMRDARRPRVPMSVLSWMVAVPLLAIWLLVIDVASHAVRWHFRTASVVPPPDGQWGYLIAVFAILVLFTAIFGHTRVFANMSSIQGFYAARLVRTFLGASNEARLSTSTPVWETTAGDDLPGNAYWYWPSRNGGHPPAAQPLRPWERGAPLHIINVTVNETVDARTGIQNQDRKGTGLALGPCGFSLGVRHHLVSLACRPNVPEPRFPAEGHCVFGERDADPETLSLGRWASLSGAAASAAAGSHTTIPIAILCGMFNIRLGYWWESGVTPKRSWLLDTLLPVQSALFQEMFASTHGTAGRLWNVSDGGHFENMGAYELVRRRLPVIVVVDAESDPDFKFRGLSDFVRKARLDFGAEVAFLTAQQLDGLEPGKSPSNPPLPSTVREYFGDLDALRRGRSVEERFRNVHGDAAVRHTIEPDRARASKAHAALARIRYRDAGEGATPSWLVYVKATLTGDEPEDVCHYHRANPNFPHETTIDQFFDEAQWESYRRLGQHIGSRVLTPELFNHLTGA
jgi:hypothetical protein